MDQRKRLVLKQIVSRYIKSGEPVSSRTLLEEYGLGVSSATIRNDMRYLEEQGYIAKPYCSAGRVPTEKGYRFFVDWLLDLSDLAKEARLHDQHALIEYYRFPRQELERLLRKTAFLLANVTGLVGFVLSPRLEETELEQITLTPLGPRQLLVVLVSNLGLVESQVLEAQFTPAELAEISALLNERLRGKPLKEIRQFFELEEEGWIEPALRNSLAILGEVLARESRQRLYIEGILSLLESVLEGRDQGDRLGVIKLLSDERRFAQFLSEVAREGEVRVLIGRENPLPELQGWSVITMGYGYGVLGGLGPLRMDYSKAFSTTLYVGNRLRAILSSAERKEVDN
ncbi:MAG: heat-inducible transcriptional repressor HrcA [Candidatus Acetothermia bacterium]|jgi:heat-inducible transcriptional repressor|nr:heat-inducible transcriptional repressor HrcA [Candidatus Acetothermia bacterium]MDH7505839.1 heat-inducible transcriptional repressor HrcA [Candidatus Acetothermia bacterium]